MFLKRSRSFFPLSCHQFLFVMIKAEYITRPLIISEKQLQKLIIDLHVIKLHCTKCKDIIPYATGNVSLHTRLSDIRDRIERIEIQLNTFIEFSDPQHSGE